MGLQLFAIILTSIVITVLLWSVGSWIRASERVDDELWARGDAEGVESVRGRVQRLEGGVDSPIASTPAVAVALEHKAARDDGLRSPPRFATRSVPFAVERDDGSVVQVRLVDSEWSGKYWGWSEPYFIRGPEDPVAVRMKAYRLSGTVVRGVSDCLREAVVLPGDRVWIRGPATWDDDKGFVFDSDGRRDTQVLAGTVEDAKRQERRRGLVGAVILGSFCGAAIGALVALVVMG